MRLKPCNPLHLHGCVHGSIEFSGYRKECFSRFIADKLRHHTKPDRTRNDDAYLSITENFRPALAIIAHRKANEPAWFYLFSSYIENLCKVRGQGNIIFQNEAGIEFLVNNCLPRFAM